MTVRHEGQEMNLLFSQITDNILRCTITKQECAPKKSHMVQEKVLEKIEEVSAFSVHVDGNNVLIAKDEKELFHIVGYELEPIDVMKHSTGGEKPVVEVIKTVDGERTVIKNLKSYRDRTAFIGTISFQLKEGEGIYGFGQDEEGVFNHRGTKEYLYQHNMRIPMPCMMSDQGYGVFFDCTSLMVFDDTKEVTQIEVDTVETIDFYLIEGSMDEVIAGFHFLTGKVAMLPKWAFGYIQSKEKYKTGDELVEVAKKYRDIGVPIDCIVQDWKTWEGSKWGEKSVDKKRFPNLKATNDKLHELNVHSMVSIWPNMAEGGANHTEFAEANLLLGDYSTYDAFDEKGRNLYWEQVKRELYSGGFDSWWCDSTEPFTSPDWCGETLLPAQERYTLVGGEHKKYLDPEEANFYAVVHAQGIYENQRKEADEKRVLNLTRSGYPGIQKYGTILWAGDTSATWKELKREIAKGLNMSMSGVPYWTVDIGAFFVGGTACWRKWSGNPEAKPVWFWEGDYDDGVENMGYRELYTRWLQFGCFLPIFRSHGTDTPREIWNFGKKGEPFYDTIEKYIKLRYKLLPYIYSAAVSAAFDDKNMMRSLLFDFSEDKNVIDLDDQFMMGEAFMVCPVTEPMYYGKDGEEIATQKVRNCYLPKGAGWFDYWTNQFYEGGQTVTVRADLATIPLFVKAGSIVTTQKEVVHSLENKTEFELEIYMGENGETIFYDDDGVSYNYEKGCFERIEMVWKNAEKTLYLKETSRMRDGAYTFHISCNGQKQTILFDGEERNITFK